MSYRATAGAWCVVLSLASATGYGAETVASVAGAEISRQELGETADETARIARFRDLLWQKVAQHYIAERGLAATPPELVEFAAYQREFERADRAQRARKLQELDLRLARDGLPERERAWLEEFRAVLTRLARDDAERDSKPAPDPAQEALAGAPWVELWKMNRALYEEYGGTVALTATGPAPLAARAALVADYERRGVVRFLDESLKSGLYALLSLPPSMVVPPARVDFTPFWQLPIPKSYFPD